MTGHAVVTGASRGIGLAIAEALVEAGYHVLGTATTQAGADQFSQRMAGQGQGYVLNLGDQSSIDAFTVALKADHDAPLILVNNAGMTQDNLAMRMKSAEWNAVINTNLNGVFHLTQSFIRGMMKAKFGRIINILSLIHI